MTRALLDIQKLGKKYGKNIILKNISFSINKGEVVGLIGHNGVGKTTLMKCILGTTGYDKGNRFFNGASIKNKECPQGIGALIEQPGIYPFFTGMENIAVLNSTYSSTEIDWLLDKFRMRLFMDRKVSSYSLGIRQKLGIVEAFLMGSKLVILDEPINALDPESVEEFREAVKYFSEKGISFLISSHIISELSKITDKILILNDTKLFGINNKKKQEMLITIGCHEIKDLKYFLEKKHIEYKLDNNYFVINSDSCLKNGNYITQIIKAGFDIKYLDLNKESIESKILKLMGDKDD